MNRVYEFLIALAIVLVLFVLVGLVLPSSRNLEHTIETNRRMTIVYDTVNNVRRLRDWNQLIPHAMQGLSYSDDTTGVGAYVDFNSEDARWGSGRWEITESEAPVDGGPAKVSFDITDERPGSGKRSTVQLEPTGRNNRNVRISQTYEVNYGWNLYSRFQGMYVNSHVGDSVRASLSRLTNALATVPNFDYRAEGITLANLGLVELPGENLLVVNAGNIDRNNEVIRASILANQEWIKRVMDNNDLEAAGPVRIITTDFGSEKYAFDVAQPVRKRGTGPARANQEGQEEEEVSSASTDADGERPPVALPRQPAASIVLPPATEPLQQVKVDGTPVEYVRLEPRVAASATYAGYMAELDVARNSLRAWAMTQGHEVIERPFESWKGGVDRAFTAEGEFDIFWQVKQ